MPQEVTVTERTDLGVEERVVELVSTQFFITVGEKKFRPAIVTSIEIENDGDVANPSDQCGNVERTKTSNAGWIIRVRGIVTGNQDRDGNLSMQMMRDYVATESTIDVRCDLFEGEIVVSNVMLTQSSDLVSVNTVSTEGPEQAFEFQLQLGEKQGGS